MKNILLLIILLSITVSKLSAQTWVAVPDLNFRTYLTANYPADAFMTSGSDFFIDAEHESVQAAYGIYVASSEIASLEGIQAFSNLTDIDCSYNMLTELPPLPATLVWLNCRNNQITALPVLPAALENLICEYNEIDVLPELPAPLIALWCGHNNLTIIPELPAGLEQLICGSNELDSLPELPETLTALVCDNNNLTALPALPDVVMSLSCAYNQLAALPQLSPNMEGLICRNNYITLLPELPATLYALDCGTNMLTALPELPAGLDNLNCEYNQIACFGEFPADLQTIYIDGNPFSCLPNYVAAMSPAVLIYPLCNENDPVNNPNGCVAAMGIEGEIFKDINADCVSTGGLLSYIPMFVYDSNEDLIVSSSSLANGEYYFAAAPGDYQLAVNTSVLSPALEVTCPVNNQNTATVSSSDPVVSGGDFGLNCTGFDLGVQSVASMGMVFPGQAHELRILAGDLTARFNAFCASGISGEVTVSVTGPGTVTFNGTPNISGNTATYSIADFGVAESNEFFAGILTDTTATSDDEFCVSVTVSTGTDGEIDEFNNSYDYCYHVVNSYDPNIKETYPEQVEPGYTGEFTYTVHFQNTGNAPAVNIRLADVLDDNLDISGFRITAASDNYVYSINPETRLLSIRFPNIMLADSLSDPEGSTGFVQYAIRPFAARPAGTSVYNTCSIYFDYNEPIVTNTTTNLFSNLGLDEMASEELKIYPNPAREDLVFETTEPMQQIAFYDLNGLLVRSSTPDSMKWQMNVSELNAGVYLVKVQTNRQLLTKRIVIR